MLSWRDLSAVPSNDPPPGAGPPKSGVCVRRPSHERRRRDRAVTAIMSSRTRGNRSTEMSVKDIVEATLGLLRILISWPVAIVVVFMTFRRELRRALPELLSRLSQRVTKASIGGTSFEFAEAQALQDTITQGAESLRNKPEEFEVFVGKQLQKAVAPHQGASRIRPLAGKKILWVDDHPENNSYESNLFVRLGARINVARSTREAIGQLDHGKYDLLITDIHRVEDDVEKPTAGYTLIAKTETRDPYTPSVIYTSNIERVDPIESAPASGVADDPRALADLVVKLIGTMPANTQMEPTRR